MTDHYHGKDYLLFKVNHFLFHPFTLIDKILKMLIVCDSFLQKQDGFQTLICIHYLKFDGHFVLYWKIFHGF